MRIGGCRIGPVSEVGTAVMECGDDGGVASKVHVSSGIGRGLGSAPSELVRWAAMVEDIVCCGGMGTGSVAKRPGGNVGYLRDTGVNGIHATESVLRVACVAGTYTR